MSQCLQHTLQLLKLFAFLRNTRKKLSKKPLEREQVKTISKYDLQHSAKMKQMVAGSKRRKAQKELT